MKKTIIVYDKDGRKEKEVNYIPFRFILAIILIAVETLAVLGIVIWCATNIPLFYLAMWATQIFCVLKIINSEENPDYKIPWLLFVMIVPVAGFMIYFMFYDRKLSKKYIRRLLNIESKLIKKDDTECFEALKKEDTSAYLQARHLCKLSRCHVYKNTEMEYFEMGEKMYVKMLEDLKKAEKFIFLEYFIVEEGLFWNSMLDIMKEKAAKGVDVRVIYDDIGCMMTLPGQYFFTLRSYGIKAVPFSRLKGQANNEFNNRSHRKIMVIDGKVGYTGGVNIADEYINEKEVYGLWKDTGLRLEGEAVAQLTSIFLGDYDMNVKTPVEEYEPYFSCAVPKENPAYVIPFGDGPRPMYQRQVAKNAIMNMLNHASDYVYMMSPYLIIDNELCDCIENAALRGVDVRIITPHIPDKKLVFMMTRSHYKRLQNAGVKIYEFEPGFVHAKVYLSDDKVAIVGTINLDYRSLVHHFENGVWMYKHEVLKDIKKDFADTMERSLFVTDDFIKETVLQRFLRAVVKAVSPML